MRKDISSFTISPDATVEEALAKIEENNHGTLVVVDAEQRVLGSLTDGDVRKALLDHRMLVIPVRDVMNPDNLFVIEGEQERASDMFRRHFYLRLLPVIDEQDMLKDILMRDEPENA